MRTNRIVEILWTFRETLIHFIKTIEKEVTLTKTTHLRWSKNETKSRRKREKKHLHYLDSFSQPIPLSIIRFAGSDNGLSATSSCAELLARLKDKLSKETPFNRRETLVVSRIGLKQSAFAEFRFLLHFLRVPARKEHLHVHLAEPKMPNSRNFTLLAASLSRTPRDP